MRQFTVAILVGLLVLAASIAAEDGKGGYAGAFLQVPIGARPTALGGTYIAISDDAAGPLYNPAGIANLKNVLFGTSYRAMQLDRKLAYASILIPVQGNSAIGFQWLYAGSGSVAARDDDGDLLGHDISFNNHNFAAVFAKRFERYFSAGAKLNYYHSTFPEVNASSVGFDLGLMLYVNELMDREKREFFPVKDIQIGLAASHLGVKFPWNSQDYNAVYGSGAIGYEQDDEVPFQIGLGASARFMQRKLLLATDVTKNEKQNIVFHGGSEYYITKEFALRAGYGNSRFSAGTGYLFKVENITMAIDYAFSTDKADEGSEHIFSFDVLF